MRRLLQIEGCRPSRPVRGTWLTSAQSESLKPRVPPRHSVVWTTIDLAEQISLVLVTQAESELRLGLVGTQAFHHRDRSAVEADEMCLLPLRELFHDDAAIERGDLPSDDGGRRAEVDVRAAPPEASNFNFGWGTRSRTR
jgi:hypothetical protein